RHPGPGFDRRSQVHGKGHRAEHAISVIHQANKLPRVSLTNQICDAVQARMPMAKFATLYEVNATAKVVDHLLIRGWVPPFGCVIILATGHDDPKAGLVASLFKL